MRGEVPGQSKGARALWQRAAKSIPEWLPMRHIDWLPAAYEVAGRFSARRRPLQHLSVLLDSRIARRTPWRLRGDEPLPTAQRFDQHKAGFAPPGAC